MLSSVVVVWCQSDFCLIKRQQGYCGGGGALVLRLWDWRRRFRIVKWARRCRANGVGCLAGSVMQAIE